MADWNPDGDEWGEYTVFVTVRAVGDLGDLDLYLTVEEQYEDERGDPYDIGSAWKWNVMMSEEDSGFGSALLSEGIATTKADAMAAATLGAREELEADGYPEDAIERALPRP